MRSSAFIAAIAVALAIAVGCTAPPPPVPTQPFASFPPGFELLMRIDLDAWRAHPEFGRALEAEIAEDPDLPNAAMLATLRNARRQEAEAPFPGQTHAIEIGVDSDFILTALRQTRPGAPPRTPDLMRSRSLVVLMGEYDVAATESFLQTYWGFRPAEWYDDLQVWGALSGPRIVIEPNRIIVAGREDDLRRTLDVRAGRRLSLRDRPGGMAPMLEREDAPTPFLVAFDSVDETRRDLRTLGLRRPTPNQSYYEGLVGIWGALLNLDYLEIALSPEDAAALVTARFRPSENPTNPREQTATAVEFARMCEGLVGAFPLAAEPGAEAKPPMAATADFEGDEAVLRGRVEWSEDSVPRVSVRDVFLAVGMAR